MEFVGTAPGEYDVLNVLGTVTLEGTLILDFTHYPGGLGLFEIITAASLTAEFDDIQIWGIHPDRVRIYDTPVSLTVEVIPEPAGLGLIALAVVTLKRKRGL